MSGWTFVVTSDIQISNKLISFYATSKERIMNTTHVQNVHTHSNSKSNRTQRFTWLLFFSLIPNKKTNKEACMFFSFFFISKPVYTEVKKDVILGDLIIQFSDQGHVKTLHAVLTYKTFHNLWSVFRHKFDFGLMKLYLTLKTIQRILVGLEYHKY